MRRSCNSLASLNSLKSNNSITSLNSLNSLTSHHSATSLSSISSRTKIYNNRDFQRYIANMEEDIIRIANHYYYFSEKYDKKINNIVNRYENRTNQLFMDLRHREAEYKRMCSKMDYTLKNADVATAATDYKVSICEIGDIDTRFRYMLLVLYLYTFVVLAMVWNL
jgi:uncharacterized protein with gpF-like domain